MRVITGTYTGNGAERKVSLGAKSGAVFAFGDATQYAAWHEPTAWAGRSNSFSTLDSVNFGCRITDDGFAVGSNAQWNSSGITYHYVALIPTDTSDFDTTSWMGNALSGTTYKMPQDRQVVGAILKRDSALSGVIASNAAPAAVISSLISGVWVTGLGVGGITVTNEVEVNQLDGPGGIGEEVSAIAFYAGSTVTTATWTGGQAAGSVVATAPRAIKMAAVYRVGVGAASARFITDTMGGRTKPASAAALQQSELALSGSLLTIGASGTSLNIPGVTYAAIVVCDGQATPKALPIVRSRGNSAVWLSGVSSGIDCGTADGALKINGPISVEWCGAIYPTAADNTDCPLLLRHGGAFQSPGSASWGFAASRAADGALAWPGPAFNIVTSDRLINAPDARSGWRSGIIAPFAALFHAVAVHDGGGSWSFYLNGALVKQRQIDAVATVGLPNIASASGHKTTIGARWNGSALVSPQKMLHRVGRVYSVALTAAEVQSRYARAMCGSAESDILRGLAEEWDAANAAGIYLPATVSALNNGAINGGSVVAL